MKRNIWILWLALALMMGGALPVFGASAQPELIGETAVLMDMKTGEILMEKNAHEQRYPASTTKVMTAILALENLNLSTQITVDEKTPYEVEGSHIALEPGEIFTVDQLLNGMLIESANDCALVLGKSIAGSTENFARMMNEKAKELGALNTNFVNPNGLHDPAHKSTAYDLAMIARYAMTDSAISEKFRELVTTYKYDVPATNKKTEPRHLYNTNRLLYDTVNKVYVNGTKRACKYDGVTGVKTGYTSNAGGCLVASAQRNGSEFLCVTMKSTDMGRFADCISMLDWAFANYRSVSPVSRGEKVGEVKIKRGSVRSVEAVSASDIYATIPMDAPDSVVSIQTVMENQIEAPVAKGQIIGKIQVYEGDELVGEFDAVAKKEIPRGGWMSIFGVTDAAAKKIYTVTGIGLLVIFLLLCGYVALKRRQIRLKKARREKRQKRIAQNRVKKEETEQESLKRAQWEREYEKRYENRYKS